MFRSIAPPPDVNEYCLNNGELSNSDDGLRHTSIFNTLQIVQIIEVTYVTTVYSWCSNGYVFSTS